ncbi:MAG: transposase family protein [Chloroflexota bacterium]|nr:transposase family protein [Chloroflexota bacterium]
MREYTLDGLPRRNRRYTPYKNSPLPTIEDKLLFILIHMKQNLTQEVQGQVFGMIQSDANKWLQVLRPVLLRALEQLDVVPARLATLSAAPETPPAADHTPFLS